jgi:hypothetical protein
MKLATWIGWSLSLLCACSRGAYDPEADDDDDAVSVAGSSSGGASEQPLPRDTEFQLRPEWEGPCVKANAVDVNLGNAPEAFVRAAQCQIDGNEPDAATVTELSTQLRTLDHVRRVDVVRGLCARAARSCVLNYTDPWQQQVELTAPCARKGTRELGAVLMYWSECPSGVNCGLDWANTHAAGMGTSSSLLAFGATKAGYYNPKNGGFWRRELLDARWSGLQFLLLNTFGPDLAQLPRLVEALEDVGGGIQVALFDDTWGWDKKTSPAPYNQKPSFDDAEAGSALIYQKWHDFYTAVPKAHWYRYQGRPLIAFYNAGTLNPQTKSAATLTRLRERFNAEFGEDPFLVIDRAFFQDPNTGLVADAQFRWNTFDGGDLSHYETKGVGFDSFMAKWDSFGRDKGAATPTATDRIIKGPELLEKYLEQSASSDLTMLATWNDLGEGTGVTRNFDYYHRGAWLPPHAFMSRIRAAQCQ